MNAKSLSHAICQCPCRLFSIRNVQLYQIKNFMDAFVEMVSAFRTMRVCKYFASRYEVKVSDFWIGLTILQCLMIELRCSI